MGGKKMEGDENQKREKAKEARRAGKKPSEVGRTTGASKQKASGKQEMTHQQKIDMKREGKQDDIHEGRNTSAPLEARPGSRDPDTADRDEPRL
jgi:hypothetical protein